MTQPGDPDRHRLRRPAIETPPIEPIVYGQTPAGDPEVAFEQRTVAELQCGLHQVPVEWRGNKRIH